MWSTNNMGIVEIELGVFLWNIVFHERESEYLGFEEFISEKT